MLKEFKIVLENCIVNARPKIFLLQTKMRFYSTFIAKILR